MNLALGMSEAEDEQLLKEFTAGEIDYIEYFNANNHFWYDKTGYLADITVDGDDTLTKVKTPLATLAPAFTWNEIDALAATIDY